MRFRIEEKEYVGFYIPAHLKHLAMIQARLEGMSLSAWIRRLIYYETLGAAEEGVNE